MRAYPETCTRDFVSLADFEDSPEGPRAHEQLAYFAVLPASPDGRLDFVVNITRTGAGALEATVPRGSSLVFRLPDIHDVSSYTLVSLAVHSRSLRDDLRVTLRSDAGEWTSPRTLVQPGWNTVLIDIRRLGERKDFDVRGVRELRVRFADAAGAITANFDDFMLINNRRAITPTPPGLTLEKVGLDYRLGARGRDDTTSLSQGADGLWRFSRYQPALAVSATHRAPKSDGEDIRLMGRRRVGHVEVVEANLIRLRIANTWYFPTRAGEWVSLAVRRVRWEYTFYADGRRVTHVELNNAGGRKIGSLSLEAPAGGTWSSGQFARSRLTDSLEGPIGRWNHLWAPPGADRDRMLRNYVNPGRIVPTIAVEAFAPGDVGRDGFDESRGCFHLRARAGHCRFRIIPPPGGLLRPIFRVTGGWKGRVSVNSEALTIRNVVRLADGSVLFQLPGLLLRPTAVEVSGKVDVFGHGSIPPDQG